MRFFTSQNKQNNNDDDVTSSDYPQTVEIPTSSSQSSPDDDNHDNTIPNNHNDSDDEGYDEFLRVCMNSMYSPKSQNKDIATAVALGEQTQNHHNNSNNNTKSQQTLASLRRISEERSKTDEFNDDDDSSGHGVSGRHNSSDLINYDPKLSNLRGSITSSNGGHTAETLGSTIKYKRSSRRASYPTRRVTNDNNDQQGQDNGGQGGQGTTSDEFNVRAAFEKEHKAVRKFKIFVILVLIVAAVTVTVLVYKFSSNSEQQTLQLEYNDYAAKFFTNFYHLNVMRQWSGYTVAGMFTAQCINGYGPVNRPWPNITLPDFPNQVRGALVLAHATTLEFSPLFPNDPNIRQGWEAYAVENENLTMHIPEWALTMDGHGNHDHGGDHGGHEMEGGKSEMNAPHGSGHEEEGEGKTEMMDHSHASNGSEGEHESDGGTDNMGHIDDMGQHDMMTMEEEFGPDMSDAMQAAITDEVVTPGLRRRKMEREDTLRGAGHEAGHGGDDSGQGGGDDHSNHDVGSAQIHAIRPMEEGIYTMDGISMVDESADVPLLAPAWHIFPLKGNEGRIMYNEYANAHKRAIDTLIKTNQPALSDVLVGSVGHHHYYKEPSSIMLYPVHSTFDENDKTLVGFISMTFSWMGVFWNILPENVRGIIAVIESSTGQLSTVRVDGGRATYIGQGDFHNPKYDHMKRSSKIYRVYGKESDIKEMIGHHRKRHLTEMDYEEALNHASSGMSHTHEENDHSHPETDDSDDAKTNQYDSPGSNVLTDGEHIDYMIHVYPSEEFESSYLTKQPRIFALAVSLVFFFTVMTFVVYDLLVERRQKRLLEEATKSGKIVDSLFPRAVRDRLFDDKDKPKPSSRTLFKSASMIEDRYLRQGHAQGSEEGSQSLSLGNLPPIADLYNDTTVMFADIAGFTAWSSEREPSQVFQLLESLFCDFDTLAKNMKVFKIETIGDCYVAVTGLPETTPLHASIMAKFAQRCLIRFSQLTKELELSLGPGTADLGIRIGLHSGPVTAGVLRGEKARFQLFGDTMNTASRMESTSIKNMIQVSADTAALLKKSNKGSILVEREGLIKAKGKGYMQTFWLRPKSMSSTSTTSSSFSESNVEFQHEADHIHSRALHDVARAELGLPSFSHQAMLTKSPSYSRFPSDSSVSWRDTGLVAERPGHHEGLSRLIKWNTKVLESILTKIVMQKRVTSHTKSNKYSESTRFHEEVAQAVSMPHFNREDMSAACLMPSKDKVNLIPNKAREELRAYVASIASMYNQVHFHSFEHASHVTMSAQKLINKVILRNSQEIRAETEVVKKSEEVDLFFSTYGISADPLAQFAVVFAALVRDVEHTGVPNVQLITENTILAEKYKNKSVAENNSIQVAWSELLKPEYTNLRKCIFATDDDELRFRQLLINVVIATDIADRERRAGEGIRWKTAFCNVSNWGEEWDGKSDDELSKVDVSLKATVVLEQIVLASDVAHTMQHWLTYVKWNERLYKEMWAAYSSGRAEKDPTENWYRGEIGFFEHYIIPLATKLKECGVFGTAGDEYLGNAIRNKTEWIEKGEAIVKEFEAKIKMRRGGSDVGSNTESTSTS